MNKVFDLIVSAAQADLPGWAVAAVAAVAVMVGAYGAKWLPWHFVRATSNNPGASRATSAPAALNQAANEEDSPA